MPKICVARVVNDITKNIVREEAERAGKDPADLPPYKFSSQALEVVQTALEGYLTDRFADMNALAHHGKRVTVRPEDARLYKRLRRKWLLASKAPAQRRHAQKATSRSQVLKCLLCSPPLWGHPSPEFREVVWL